MSHTTLLAYIPSPSQGVWHLGPFPLRAYALCIIVGIVVAVWWGDRRWRARGGQPGDVLDVALFAVPFGLVGGRLYHVLTDWKTYFGADGKGLSGAVAVWDGGLGIWGAVILGGVGAWIACRFWKGIKLPAFGDALAPPILLAQAIGRLGNYFNQELYGGQTTLPWGLELYWREDGSRRDIALPNGVSTGDVAYVVHPTFLYEMLWNILVVIALVLIDRQFRIGHGRLFALYVAGYCLGRFGVEMLRTDPATHILGLRINLFTSAILFLCAALYFVLAPRGRETGLAMYWPKRAEELAADGESGHVSPSLDDDLPDEPVEQPDDEGDEGDEGEDDGGEDDAQWAPIDPVIDEEPVIEEPVIDEEPTAGAGLIVTADAAAARDAGGIEIREVIAADPEATKIVIKEAGSPPETDEGSEDEAEQEGSAGKD